MRYRSFAAAWLLLAASCGAHKLHQAQTNFNDGARTEAQTNLEQEHPTADPGGELAALQSYRVARGLTEEALRDHKKSLKKDQLYGTALMLRALSQWRIAALSRDLAAEEAVESTRQLVADIKEQAQASEVILGTRDRVMFEALPGLLEHSLGLQEPDPDKAARLFESALETLEASLTTVMPPADHPVRVYIRLSQMRILRAWRWVEYPRLPTDAQGRREWTEDWKQRYEKYRDPLVPLLEANRGLRLRVMEMDKVFGFQSS